MCVCVCVCVKISHPNLLPQRQILSRIRLRRFPPPLLKLPCFPRHRSRCLRRIQRAPEHPLPAGYDCWAAINWVASHKTVAESEKVKVNISESLWLNEYGDFDRVYIGGDSSGANIVHNMAMRAGVECLVNGVNILGAFLSHPFFLESKTLDTDDGLDLEEKLWLFVYLDAEGGVDSLMINPLAGGAPSLKGLGCKKMLVVVLKYDLGRGKGVKYYEGVKKSGWGGEVELIDVEGEGHCFHAYNPDSEKARILISQMAAFIK